ncbi:hypothetical protein NGF19_19275 [Streptomyces sp. RY43-2]|uniref:Bacterial Ig-like domain-containing protein n=1 Tax=Streptomyces macrolidinus TaxID=2952607 RepID=A0ABT0ZH84_9ACTN|nr:hypothetical protein [Streptomyces macrolidinus]MCN9242912.1 hypothetical protein [Streptomyces macrolidinus]
MSDTSAKGRRVIQGIDASGGYPVEYRFAPARSGNRHLMVVFANMFAPDDYGWATGILDNLRSNILWIRDRFDGGNTYYLCKGMDFAVEQSVIGLVSRVIKSLGLTPGDVTLWGSSKGGTAALYFGLRYGFRNIVASVPQLRMGTFLRDVYPDTGRHMLGETMPDANVAVLDAIMPDLLASGANPDAHIYMVSSPQDEQYSSQVEPFLGLLQRYKHFNFIFSESPFITDHGKVTQRNTPPLLGIAYLLVEGISPRLGLTRHGYEEPEADTSGIDAFLKSTSVVQESFAAPVVTMPTTHDVLPAREVHFEGRAPGAVRVSIWENGKYLASAPVGADGGWVWDRNQPWSTGEHLVRLFAVDANGYQSERSDVRFTVSENAPAQPGGHAAGVAYGYPGTPRVLPAPVVQMPEPHRQALGTRVGFAGVAGGAAQVGFRENGVFLGACAVAPDGRWSWDPGRPWAEGPHTVEVFAVDVTGGESPASSVPFVVTGDPAGTAPPGY